MFVEHTNLLQAGVKSKLALQELLLEFIHGIQLLLQLREKSLKRWVIINLAFKLQDQLFHFGELVFP